MSFNVQKFLEVLAYIGGLALFIRITILTLKSRDRISIAILTAAITIAALSSFASET